MRTTLPSVRRCMCSRPRRRWRAVDGVAWNGMSAKDLSRPGFVIARPGLVTRICTRMSSSRIWCGVTMMSAGPRSIARSLYGWAKTVGYLYEAQLRAELTRRLAVGWTPARNGIAELEGFSGTVLRAFSRRRCEIEMHMEERGETGARAAQRAAYATRKPKTDTPAEGLLPEWRARSAALGLADDGLAAVLFRAEAGVIPQPGTLGTERLFALLASPRGLTARSASFGRREVLQAIAAALPTGRDGRAGPRAGRRICRFGSRRTDRYARRVASLRRDPPRRWSHRCRACGRAALDHTGDARDRACCHRDGDRTSACRRRYRAARRRSRRDRRAVISVG